MSSCPTLKNYKKVWFNNDDELIMTALNDPAFWIRSQATEHINDESVLIKIAINDSNKYVRTAAIHNPYLTDEKFLIDIAYNGLTKFERKQAVIKITDKSVLEDIVKNESSKLVRKGVILNPNFNNKDMIKDLANYDHTIFIRMAAWKLLNDEKYQSKVFAFFGKKQWDS